MRGDLTVTKAANVLGLMGGDRFVVDGARIAATNAAGVGKRDAERSFRVSMNAASVAAVAPDAEAGDVIPVRFMMTLNHATDGGRVYVMVPAGDRDAHGVIRTRK